MHVCVCNGQRDDKRSNSVRGKFCTKLNVYKKSNKQKKKHFTVYGVEETCVQVVCWTGTIRRIAN